MQLMTLDWPLELLDSPNGAPVWACKQSALAAQQEAANSPATAGPSPPVNNFGRITTSQLPSTSLTLALPGSQAGPGVSSSQVMFPQGQYGMRKQMSMGLGAIPQLEAAGLIKQGSMQVSTLLPPAGQPLHSLANDGNPFSGDGTNSPSLVMSPMASTTPGHVDGLMQAEPAGTCSTAPSTRHASATSPTTGPALIDEACDMEQLDIVPHMGGGAHGAAGGVPHAASLLEGNQSVATTENNTQGGMFAMATFQDVRSQSQSAFPMTDSEIPLMPSVDLRPTLRISTSQGGFPTGQSPFSASKGSDLPPSGPPPNMLVPPPTPTLGGGLAKWVPMCWCAFRTGTSLLSTV